MPSRKALAAAQEIWNGANRRFVKSRLCAHASSHWSVARSRLQDLHGPLIQGHSCMAAMK
jgi:hypothetical protein